jgi:subtilisin family serine protease
MSPILKVGGMTRSRAVDRRAVTALATALLALAVLAPDSVARAESRPESQPGWQQSSPGFVVPDDPLLREQWWLFNFGQQIGGRVETKADADIRAPEAWSVTTGTPDVVVAVLDFGIDYDHPEFDGQLWTNPGETGGGRESNGIDDDGNGYIDDWRGWDFVAGDNDPLDEDGHGTRVAGVVAAKGGDATGITGIAPGVRLMPLRVADTGVDFGVTPAAIDYAARMGARIVVQSYSSDPSGLFDRSDAETAAMLAHQELLFVTGAGNDGNDYRGFEGRAGGLKPCNNPTVPNLLCVAGTDRFDKSWDESTFGVGRVHLGAPAESMLVVARPREVAVDDHFADTGSWAPAADMQGAFWMPVGPAPTFAFEADTAAADGRVLHITHSPPAGTTATGVIRLGERIDVTGRTGCKLNVNVAGTVTGAASVDLGLFRESDERRNAFGGQLTITTNQLRDAGDGFQSLSIPLRAHEPLELAIKAEARAGAASSIDVRIDDWQIDCWNPEHGDRDYEYWAGTSFATPLTAGVAALVASAHPELDSMQIRQAILESAVEITTLEGKVQTGGRLDAYGALLRAAELASTSSPSAAPAIGAASTTDAAVGKNGAGVSFAPHADYEIPAVGQTKGVPGGRGMPDPAAAPVSASGPGGDEAADQDESVVGGAAPIDDGGGFPTAAAAAAAAVAAALLAAKKVRDRARKKAEEERRAVEAAQRSRTETERLRREALEAMARRRAEVEREARQREEEEWERFWDQQKQLHESAGDLKRAREAEEIKLKGPPSSREGLTLEQMKAAAEKLASKLGVGPVYRAGKAYEELAEKVRETSDGWQSEKEVTIAARAEYWRQQGHDDEMARNMAESEYSASDPYGGVSGRERAGEVGEDIEDVVTDAAADEAARAVTRGANKYVDDTVKQTNPTDGTIR